MSRRGFLRTSAVVTTGLAALADLPALLVSDVGLPDGNGLDVVRAATMMQPRIPAVVMSARASEPDRTAAREAGAVGFLSKPFTAQEFNDVVDCLLTGDAASARD